MDGLDPIGKSWIAISHDKVSLYLKTPIPRFTTPRDPRPHVPVEINDGDSFSVHKGLTPTQLLEI
jgi:hypothetical protein